MCSQLYNLHMLYISFTTVLVLISFDLISIMHFIERNKQTRYKTTNNSKLVTKQQTIYLKGIKFRGYLISRLEKNYILQVFNFRIWRLQNISQVLIL